MLRKDKKSILIDVTVLFDQFSYRGIGKYAKASLLYLIPILIENNWEVNLIGFKKLNANLVEIGFSKFQVDEYLKKVRFYRIPRSLSNISNLGQWFEYFKPVLEGIEPTVYLSFQFERGLPKITPSKVDNSVKSVVIAHDVIPVIYNLYSEKGWVQNQIKKFFYHKMLNNMKGADLIVAVSENTKRDLINVTGFNSHNVKRIYNGIEEKFVKENHSYTREQFTKLKEEFEIGKKKFFFSDSGLERNRATEKLLTILKLTFDRNAKGIPKYLVLTGGGALSKGVGNQIRPLSNLGRKFLSNASKLEVLDRIISTGVIKEEELVILTAEASVYINLSDYEGFGFGPVHSMAAQTPAIVSNRSCFPEIVKDGALQLNTENIEESVETLISFLQDQNKVSANVKKGIKVSKKYNWKLTAKELFEAIDKLAEE